MGQKIVLSDVVFTDTTLPVVLNDPILSNGSLFLFDPSHSLGVFNGVPSNGGTVPNIAWAEAAAILGSGTQASLAGNVISVNPTEASKSLVERTSKLGIHSIVSQVSQTAENSWYVNLPTAIRDFMYTNRTAHNFYISVWSRITRAAVTNTSGQSLIHFAANTTNFLFHGQRGIPNCAGSNLRSDPSGVFDSAVTAPVPRYLSMSPTGQSGTGVISTNNITFGLGNFGLWQSLNINKCPSRILYRVYVEDLTVSGRTYAQVDAIDYALYQAAFASGGKFYNDTYTNPTTIP